MHAAPQVKCNPDVAVLSTLAALGAGFDCASEAEIRAVSEAQQLADPRVPLSTAWGTLERSMGHIRAQLQHIKAQMEHIRAQLELI